MVTPETRGRCSGRTRPRWRQRPRRRGAWPRGCAKLIVPPAEAEEVEDLVPHRGRERHLERGARGAGHVGRVVKIGDPLVDPPELRMAPEPLRRLAAVAE